MKLHYPVDFRRGVYFRLNKEMRLQSFWHAMSL